TDLLARGDYNCVSGTAFYALALKRLGFAVQIVETPFHCYLRVLMDGDTLLLEATAGRAGLLLRPAEVRAAEARYEADARRALQLDGLPSPLPRLRHPVDLASLCGLQYYNLGVAYYNRRQLAAAQAAIQTSYQYYPSRRAATLWKQIRRQ
ncbi:MAG: hypothetical protein WBA12_08495, partial [Catalinimonas sp.]